MVTITEDQDAIRVEELYKTYYTGIQRKPVEALRGVSFKVKRGEIFAFLGPNGAGKTTTIKILLDHARPTSGRAEIMGVTARSPKARQQVGYLPDMPHYYRFLTARELLEYMGRLHNLQGSQLDRRIADLIALVGLEGREEEPLRGFSRGMLQRLGMAQALINDPPILILDEPLTGLDPIGRHQFRSLILDFQQKGKTIFFSSHILEDAERLADRVAIIHKGKVRASGTLSEIMRHQPGWEVELLQPDPHLQLELEQRGLRTETTKDDTVKVTLPDADTLHWVLRVVQEGKAHLLSLQMRRMTLEEAFFAELQDE